MHRWCGVYNYGGLARAVRVASTAGVSRASEAFQRSADHTWRGGAWAAASRFFRNPYSLVGREGSWCSDGYYTKALLVDAKHTPVIPLAIAESQPELVSPVLCCGRSAR